MGCHFWACVLSHFSHVWLFATLWTIACQTPLSMGFSRKEYYSEFPCPPPGDLPNPGIEPVSAVSPALQAALFFFLPLHHRGRPSLLRLGYKKTITSILGALSWVACLMGSQLLYHKSTLWIDPCGEGSVLTNHHINVLGRRSRRWTFKWNHSIWWLIVISWEILCQKHPDKPRFLTHISCEIITVYCFKFVSFGVIYYAAIDTWGFLGGSDGEESACNAEDVGSIPGLGRSPGEENGYYSL